MTHRNTTHEDRAFLERYLTKLASSGSGTILPCYDCNRMWTLEVTRDVGRTNVTDTLGPQPVFCAY